MSLGWICDPELINPNIPPCFSPPLLPIKDLYRRETWATQGQCSMLSVGVLTLLGGGIEFLPGGYVSVVRGWTWDVHLSYHLWRRNEKQDVERKAPEVLMLAPPSTAVGEMSPTMDVYFIYAFSSLHPLLIHCRSLGNFLVICKGKNPEKSIIFLIQLILLQPCWPCAVPETIRHLRPFAFAGLSVWRNFLFPMTLVLSLHICDQGLPL